MSGPTTDETPYTPPVKPLKASLLANGTDVAIMRYEPENTPAEPKPAIARPRIRAGLFGVTAQMRDPSSK
jgi:hypothetical protein